MRYALRKQDKIAHELSYPYLENHILFSLDKYFESRTDEQIQDEIDLSGMYSNVQYQVLRVTDLADGNYTLEFAILGRKYDVMKLSYLGRVNVSECTWE